MDENKEQTAEQKNAATAAGKAGDEKAANKDNADKAPAAKTKAKVKALQVLSAREGFRRGGQVFGRAVRTVLISDLSKEQIEQIKNEKLLVVSEVEVDAA